MKYRSFPVVSLFASLPAWAFEGMMQISEAGFGSQVEFSLAASYAGIPETMPAPVEMSMVSKQPGEMISFSDFTSQHSLPELQETQQARLTQIFSNFLVEVSRYSNNQQSISVRAPDKTKLSSEEGSGLSDYQILLYRLIEHFAFHDLSVTFNENQGSFILSSRLNPAVRVEVPSRVDTKDFPEGTLEGFAVLQQTALTDMTSAWSCLRENAGILSTFMLACSDSSTLVWSYQKKGYVYEASTPSPVSSGHPFSLLQFGFAEGWHLSAEYVLLAVNGKPVNVSVVGDISFDDEPADGEGGGNNDKGKQAKGDHADSGGDKEDKEKPKRRGKKKKKGPNKGDDDPRKNRTADYGPRKPKFRYFPDREVNTKVIAKVAGKANPPSEKAVKRLQNRLAGVSLEVNKLKHNLETKWQSKPELESRNREAAIKRLHSLEQQQQELQGKLKQEQHRLTQAQLQLQKIGSKLDQLEQHQETTRHRRKEIDRLVKEKTRLETQLKKEELIPTPHVRKIRKLLQQIDEKLIEQTSSTSVPVHRRRGSKLDSITSSADLERWEGLVADDLDGYRYDSEEEPAEPDEKREFTMTYSDYQEHPEYLELHRNKQEETSDYHSSDGSTVAQFDHTVTSPQSENVLPEVTTEAVVEETSESLDSLDITDHDDFPVLGSATPQTSGSLKRIDISDH